MPPMPDGEGLGEKPGGDAGTWLPGGTVRMSGRYIQGDLADLPDEQARASGQSATSTIERRGLPEVGERGSRETRTTRCEESEGAL